MALIARQNFVNVNWNIEGLKGRGKRWQAPAVASAITGLYITLAGILVMVAPLYTFGKPPSDFLFSAFLCRCDSSRPMLCP